MRVVKRIRLKDKIRYTRNLFGPASDLRGKTMDVLEENKEGVCLSLFYDEGKAVALIDVDPRDIEEHIKSAPNSFFNLDVVRWVEEFIGRSLESI